MKFSTFKSTFFQLLYIITDFYFSRLDSEFYKYNHFEKNKGENEALFGRRQNKNDSSQHFEGD